MTATMERTPTVLAADTLTGDKVVNFQKEDLGKIEHLMIDLESGRVVYGRRTMTTRRFRNVALLFFLGVLVPSSARAQTDSALLSKVSFNLTNPGGKSLAMGGAFTAIADDATAALANPAGLGLISSVESALSGKSSNDTRSEERR